MRASSVQSTSASARLTEQMHVQKLNGGHRLQPCACIREDLAVRGRFLQRPIVASDDSTYGSRTRPPGLTGCEWLAPALQMAVPANGSRPPLCAAPVALTAARFPKVATRTPDLDRRICPRRPQLHPGDAAALGGHRGLRRHRGGHVRVADQRTASRAAGRERRPASPADPARLNAAGTVCAVRRGRPERSGAGAQGARLPGRERPGPARRGLAQQRVGLDRPRPGGEGRVGDVLDRCPSGAVIRVARSRRR